MARASNAFPFSTLVTFMIQLVVNALRCFFVAI